MAILDQNGLPFPARPEQREIASASLRDKYSSYPSQGLTPQRLAKILKEADQGDIYRQMELFEEMEEKDPHLFSIFQTRKLAVQGLEWEIMPYSVSTQDKKIAEFVGEVLYNLDCFDDMIVDLLDAIGKGLAVSEIMWTIRNSQVWINDIKWRHQKRFTYDDYWNLRLLTDESPALGIEMPPAKFVVHKYKAKSGYPGRAGVLRVCAWMYLFKNYDIKDWVSFAEVYGKPIRLGKFKPGATKEDKETLYQAIVQLGTDAAGVISESTMIEFIETKTAAGATVHQALAAYCDAAMSKAVLGQTLTTEIGDKGSFAASKTHDGVRQDIKEADCKALAKTIGRDLIRPLVLFNFGEITHMPWLKFRYEPPEDIAQTANTYKVVIRDIGLPVSQEHVYERFGIPKPEEGQALINPPQEGQQGNTIQQVPNKSSNQTVTLIHKDSQLQNDLEDVKRVIQTLPKNEKDELGPRFFYDDADYRYIERIGNSPVGFVENRITGKTAHLNLAVSPQYRNKGIASKMIKKAINDLPDSVEKINWITSTDNKASKILAEKSGFKFVRENDGEARYALPNVSKKAFSTSTEVPNFHSGMKAIDDLADRCIPPAITAISDMLEPIYKLMANSNSLEEIKERIIEAYPNMDTSKLEDQLGKAFYVADLFGRLTVQGDDDA